MTQFRVLIGFRRMRPKLEQPQENDRFELITEADAGSLSSAPNVPWGRINLGGPLNEAGVPEPWNSFPTFALLPATDGKRLSECRISHWRNKKEPGRPTAALAAGNPVRAHECFLHFNFLTSPAVQERAVNTLPVRHPYWVKEQCLGWSGGLRGWNRREMKGKTVEIDRESGRRQGGRGKFVLEFLATSTGEAALLSPYRMTPCPCCGKKLRADGGSLRPEDSCARVQGSDLIDGLFYSLHSRPLPGLAASLSQHGRSGDTARPTKPCRPLVLQQGNDAVTTSAGRTVHPTEPGFGNFFLALQRIGSLRTDTEEQPRELGDVA